MPRYCSRIRLISATVLPDLLGPRKMRTAPGPPRSPRLACWCTRSPKSEGGQRLWNRYRESRCLGCRPHRVRRQETGKRWQSGTLEARRRLRCQGAAKLRVLHRHGSYGSLAARMVFQMSALPAVPALRCLALSATRARQRTTWVR